MDKYINFSKPSKGNIKRLQQNKNFYSQQQGSSKKKKQSFDSQDQYTIQQQKKKTLQSQPTQLESKFAPKNNHQNIKPNQTQTHLQGINSESQAKVVEQKNQKKDKLLTHPYIHLMFSDNKRPTVFRRHVNMVYRGLYYSMKNLKGPSDKYIKLKMVKLEQPKNKKGKALVLDLDETLIHSTTFKQKPMVKIQCAPISKGELNYIGINLRPYCIQFLQNMSKYYDLYVFTAGTLPYAQPIISYLNSKGANISDFLSRKNCMQTKNGFFIKDLRIIANYELKDILIVDNLVHSFGLQLQNGIPIIEFHDDYRDQQLQSLEQYLIQGSKHNDLRIYNQKLKLKQLVNYSIKQIDNLS